VSALTHHESEGLRGPQGTTRGEKLGVQKEGAKGLLFSKKIRKQEKGDPAGEKEKESARTSGRKKGAAERDDSLGGTVQRGRK